MLKHGADLKAIYPFPEFKVNTEELNNELMVTDITSKSNYKCPLAFYYVLKGNVSSQQTNMWYLVNNGITFDASQGAVDSENRDIYMHAVLKNNKDDLEFLMTLKNGTDKAKAGASLDH